jgi:hypothetical protein
MSNNLLVFADYFFLIFHSLLICFNLFAWLWKPLRKLHFAIILLTLGSWVFLGIWYGWGYCPLTDWHWEILQRLGEKDLPASYISYILERLFKLDVNPTTVDFLTLLFALLAFVISIKVNFLKRIFWS